MELKACKTCGGTLVRKGNYQVCEYCGNRWEIDVANDIHAVERANAWEALREGDFEKAAELFENILMKDEKDHEAHWGCALALGGIVYVNDMSEHKKVPTCSNITEESFVQAPHVLKAIALAPPDIRENYQSQAQYIDNVRLEWLEKASKEPPYDVFISYKDSDREHGIDRTRDSQSAQDLYQVLLERNYRVFFSRITLQSKVAEQYEPYIYNAIKTAKVMIVYGEKLEYFSAPWIKNEWKRFMARQEKGEKHKNALVVAYKNINPGDLPVVLRSRQAMDAAGFSFMTNLLAHIERVIEESKQAAHLERIEIKGGQISKKATRIANQSLQVRELGSGAAANISISEKQQLSLASSYMKAGRWGEAGRLLDGVLFNNHANAKALWMKLQVMKQARNNTEMIARLPQFTAQDFNMVRQVLENASKGDAAEILDLMYISGRNVPQEVFYTVLNTILPYNYDNRQANIRQSFDIAIQRNMFSCFGLLLTTLASDDVDRYIDYHNRYARATKNMDEKMRCVQAVLSVDNGNIGALTQQFNLLWNNRQTTAAQLVSCLENILKYAKKPQEHLRGMLEEMPRILNNKMHCDFLRQAAKYYVGDLKNISTTLRELGYAMIGKGIFDEAEYWLNLALSVDEDNPDLYWGICLVRTRSTDDAQVNRSPVMLQSVPEYTKYLTLVDERTRQRAFRIEEEQRKNLKKNQLEDIMKAADRALSRRMFSEAIRCYSQALSFDICDQPRALWGICLARSSATNNRELADSSVLLNKLPEYNSYLSKASPANRSTAMSIAKEQENKKRMRAYRAKARTTLIFQIIGISLGVLLGLFMISCMFQSCEVCTDCGQMCGECGVGCVDGCADGCSEFAPICADCGCSTCLSLTSGCVECGSEAAYICADCGGCSVCGSVDNCTGLGAACDKCAKELDPDYYEDENY